MKKILFLVSICLSFLITASGEEIQASLVALLQKRSTQIEHISTALAKLTEKYEHLELRITKLIDNDTDSITLESPPNENINTKRKRTSSAKFKGADMLLFRYNTTTKEACTYHEDESIHIWDLKNYKEIKAFNNITKLPIQDICIYPFKPYHYVVATATSLVLTCCNTPIWHTTNKQTEGISVLYYTYLNPDYLYSGHKDGTVRLWNIHTGQYLQEFILFETPGTIFSLCIPEQNVLIAAQLTGTIAIKSLTSLASKSFITSVDEESIIQVCPYDKSKIAIAGKDIKMYLLDNILYSVSHINTSNEVTSISISTTKPYHLLAGLKNGTIELWNLEDALQCKARWNAHDGPVIGITFEDNCIFSAGEEGCMKVWQLQDTTITEKALLYPTPKVVKKAKK